MGMVLGVQLVGDAEGLRAGCVGALEKICVDLDIPSHLECPGNSLFGREGCNHELNSCHYS